MPNFNSIGTWRFQPLKWNQADEPGGVQW